MSTKSTKPRVTTKQDWLAANDSGPHVAVLPSGKAVRFRIPNTAALLKSRALPDRLREAAIFFTSHPEGADELMRELVITAAIRGPGQDTLARMVQAGNELTPYLIADMLVEPAVTPEEVAEGLLPELDLKMLLEFADRRRNADAEGNELPIKLISDMAPFRAERKRREGNGDGSKDAGEPAGAVSDPDGDAV